jgi:hypothetical protein
MKRVDGNMTCSYFDILLIFIQHIALRKTFLGDFMQNARTVTMGVTYVDY